MVRNRLQISAGLLIYGAFMLLLLPLPWLVAWGVAAAVHELGHIVMLKLLRHPIYRIRITHHGAALETDFLPPMQELLCAFAGPSAGLALLLFVEPFPRLALCAVVQSAFNLLPIYPLDGGRVVQCVAQRFSVSYAEAFCKILEWVCLAAIVILGIRFGMWLLALVLVLRIKIPCKSGK